MAKEFSLSGQEISISSLNGYREKDKKGNEKGELLNYGSTGATNGNGMFWNYGTNPAVAFNFMLRVEGVFDCPCRAVRAFTKENEFEYIQEGGLNDYVHMKRKPISKPFTFQVERYVGIDGLLFDPLALGTDLVLPLILLVNRYHWNASYPYPTRTYTFTGCTVISKEYGELSAEKSGLLVETTTIAYREMVNVDIGIFSNSMKPWSFKGHDKAGEGTRSARRIADAAVTAYDKEKNKNGPRKWQFEGGDPTKYGEASTKATPMTSSVSNVKATALSNESSAKTLSVTSDWSETTAKDKPNAPRVYKVKDKSGNAGDPTALGAKSTKTTATVSAESKKALPVTPVERASAQKMTLLAGTSQGQQSSANSPRIYKIKGGDPTKYGEASKKPATLSSWSTTAVAEPTEKSSAQTLKVSSDWTNDNAGKSKNGPRIYKIKNGNEYGDPTKFVGKVKTPDTVSSTSTKAAMKSAEKNSAATSNVEQTDPVIRRYRLEKGNPNNFIGLVDGENRKSSGSKNANKRISMIQSAKTITDEDAEGRKWPDTESHQRREPTQQEQTAAAMAKKKALIDKKMKQKQAAKSARPEARQYEFPDGGTRSAVTEPGTKPQARKWPEVSSAQKVTDFLK